MRGSRLLCLVFGLSLLASSPALAQNPAESGDEPAAGAVGDAAGAAEAAAEEVGGDAAEAVDATEEAADAAEEAADAAEEAADAAEEAADAAEEAADEVPPARTFADYAADNPAPPAGGTSGDAPSSGTDWRRITEAELLEPSQTYPWIEWHGYFRFRADSFWNLDLDTNGTSPILPPIEAMIAPGAETDLVGLTAGADDLTNIEAEHIGGANIRLRLHPIFQITEKTRIHLELNVLDNIVLGSTPDGYNEFNPTALRTDLPVIGFTGGQEPPSLLNAGRDSISVTQAYGEVNTFFGTIRLGRMASQWGLLQHAPRAAHELPGPVDERPRVHGLR